MQTYDEWDIVLAVVMLVLLVACTIGAFIDRRKWPRQPRHGKWIRDFMSRDYKGDRHHG